MTNRTDLKRQEDLLRLTTYAEQQAVELAYILNAMRRDFWLRFGAVYLSGLGAGVVLAKWWWFG